MAHRDVELPASLAFGIEGGPAYSTAVARNLGGYELRNKNMSAPLRDYTLAFPPKLKSGYDDLLDFMEVIAEGMANSWLLVDPFDYSATSTEGILTLLAGSPQTAYQAYKRRIVGAYSKDRIIQKLRSGTVTVYDNGVLKGSGVSIDYTTGIFTITSGTGPFTWAGEFCVPVRFAEDPMKAAIIDKGSELIVSWRSIPVVEVRLD